MASTDRAFRALARASPSAIVALLRVVATDVPWSTEAPIVLDDPNLDPPPHPRAADWVARIGEPDIHHVECQGYRDPGFLDRLFDYHVMLVLRHRERRVRTIALWTRVPPPEHRARVIVRGDLTLRLRSVVLPEVPAHLLLADPQTACFAAGADPGGMTAEALCQRVAHIMAAHNPTFEQQYMAAMVAASQRRYPLMVRAMEQANMEPVIIEDLVDYGFDQGMAAGIEQGIEKGIERGIEKGIEKGIEQGRTALIGAVLDVLDARGLAPTVAQRERLAGEHDPARLRAWCRRAATAESVEAIFE